MTREEQIQILNWIHNAQGSVALFIEPIGKGELLDSEKLSAKKKSYYDKLFKENSLEIIEEGRFIWNDPDQEFEHYTTTDGNTVPVYFNRTYYWIVS